jgi:hypothetical protein
VYHIGCWQQQQWRSYDAVLHCCNHMKVLLPLLLLLLLLLPAGVSVVQCTRGSRPGVGVTDQGKLRPSAGAVARGRTAQKGFAPLAKTFMPHTAGHCVCRAATVLAG